MHRGSGRRRATWASGLVALGTAAAALTPAAPSGAASAAPASVTLTATARDLGTLGGGASSAVDIDGDLVVGSAFLPSGQPHAFAYDLATSTMRDLGTLGGATSEARAVDGTVVVGQSRTAAGDNHAFAIDLAAASPQMRDLGTLGGRESRAVAEDGSLVVGLSQNSVFGGGAAFVYDLSQPTPTMRNLGDNGGASDVSGSVVVGQLQTAFVYDVGSSTMTRPGTLGGTASWATAIDGRVVVGNSVTSSNRTHAFAYDLAAASPSLRDLGTLGGRYSVADDAQGRLVVGHSETAGNDGHAFVYDLDATAAPMRDLGSLGEYSAAYDLDRNLVVGVAQRAGDGTGRAFAYDLSAAEPELTDLGTLGGSVGGAAAVQGDRVVGTSMTSRGDFHATVWQVRTSTAPALELGAFRYAVQENATRARVTVMRGGSTAGAVSVRYATRGFSATAGRDFRSTSGVLRFPAGQTRATFTVPLIDDSVRERKETVMLTLTSPSSGAILATPNAAALVIRASDQRPDGWVSTRASSGFAGNNVYTGNGRRQTRTLTARRTQTRTFHVRVYNDGNATNTFVVRGTAARAGSTVRYFDGTTDVTGALRSRVGLRLSLAPRAYKALTVRLTPTRSAAAGSLKSAAIIATWRGDGTRSDTVRAVVRVVR